MPTLRIAAILGTVLGVALAPGRVGAQAPSPSSLVGRIQPVFASEAGAAIVLAPAEADWALDDPHLRPAYGNFAAVRPVSDRLPEQHRAWLGRDARVLVGDAVIPTTVRSLAILSVVGSLDASPPAPSTDDGEIARRTIRLAETAWLVGLTDVVGDDTRLATFDPSLAPHVLPVTRAPAATRAFVVHALVETPQFVDDAMAFELSLRRDEGLTETQLRAALSRGLELSQITAHGRRFVLARYTWDDDCGGGSTTLLLERTASGLVRFGHISPFVALVDLGADNDLLLVTEDLETLTLDAIGTEALPVAERHHVVLGCRC